MTMYVRNAWYVVGWSGDLEAGRPYAITILSDPIVIYRVVGSERLVALEDCSGHSLAPLSLEHCEEEKLYGECQGLPFGPDGVMRDIPEKNILPSLARVRAYPIIERASWLWVWMGDVEKADEALVPPLIGPDNPDFIMWQGIIDYEAEARLINDNLLNIGHLTCIHAANFEPDNQFAQGLSKFETLERGIRYSRWEPNVRGPLGRKSDELLDNFMCYEFHVPGVLQMWSGGFPAGTSEACNFRAPPRSKACAYVTFTCEAVTPMTLDTTRHFFCGGPHRGHGDEKLRDLLINLAVQAINEAKVIFEAPHEIIATTHNPVVMPTAHDRSVKVFNRIVERMVRGEEGW
jgi:phenylpropionate dioxygenase-like ring-hydroxylating dioxygenase large terminal subunit